MNKLHPRGEFVETPADNGVEADTHPLPLEKQSRANLRPIISTKASNAESTLQRLERPAVHWAELQVNQTQSGLGEPQDGSRSECTDCPLYSEAGC